MPSVQSPPPRRHLLIWLMVAPATAQQPQGEASCGAKGGRRVARSGDQRLHGGDRVRQDRAGETSRSPTTTAASRMRTRATATARSRITARRSGPMPRSPSPTTTAALSTPTRVTSTAPSRITARRSGSIPSSRSPSRRVGNAYFDKRDYDRSLADYSEAARLDPKLAIAVHNRGLVYREKGMVDQAIADYSEAIRLDPTYRDASTTAASPIATRVTSPVPSPTTPRRSGSIRNSSRRSAAAPPFSTTGRTMSGRSPT